MDLNKINSQTPRRTLGLRRISPRAQPSKKRLSNSPVQQQTSKDNEVSASSKSPIEGGTGHLINPMKRQKMFLDNLIFGQKNKNTGDNYGEDDDDKIIKELKAENADMKHRLENYEKYRIKRKELQHLIRIWSNGGKEALKMLQEEVKPEQEMEQILTHLKLPTDIFDVDI